ncbi:MAG: response regulator [Syntrophobacteraceae bacterium]|nr:response regulator [Syntrophobacteraceae bacterium]
MKIRVLLVDDETDFREALAERLEVRRFLVTQASSGDEAIELLKGQEVDVVVLDMLMPGKDGMQTLREIKEIRPLAEIILLTGHGTPGKGVDSIQTGAFNYMTKPANLKELLENIVNAFKRKSEHEERIRRANIRSIEIALKEPDAE